MRKRSDQGFTMLEMAIAITILGILMIAVSQLMNSQIRLYDTVNRHNELEQKARVSMMHILDEIRLHKSTYFVSGPIDKGIYATVPNPSGGADLAKCLININPSPSGLPPGTGIYFNQGEHNLWFRDPATGEDYLISDEIHSVEIDTSTTNRLVRINIIARDERTGDEFQLLSWSRLY